MTMHTMKRLIKESLLFRIILLGIATLLLPARAAQPTVHPIAVITTTKGPILIRLYPEDAPLSVANFIKLVKMHFYNGTKIHRVADLAGAPGSGQGHIVQGGDPSSRTLPAGAPQLGQGGPGWSIKGEFASNGVKNPLSHGQGAFAMARSDSPNSAGSQFYIVVTPAHELDGKYAVFGQVIKGIDVANQLVTGDTILNIEIEKGR